MSEPLPTLAEACRLGKARLAGYTESARIDAEYLLAFVTGLDRSHFRAHPERPLEAAAWTHFQRLIEQRRQSLPVAYLTGERGFMDWRLQVDARVLIPRPETEHLVEAALEQPAQSVLDLGTGSGCIAIALAKAWPEARVDAVDESADALAVAQANIDRIGVPQIRLLQGAWYQPVTGQRYDLIVSNPPYIADHESHPDQGDAQHEPRGALRAGPTGLEAIEQIIHGAADHLLEGGRLWLEHGYRQGPAVRQRLGAAGFVAIDTRMDFTGHERITGGCWPEMNA